MNQTISPSRQRDYQSHARVFDYRRAANPIRAGLTEPIPLRRWGPELHATGPTAILPLDLSPQLGCEGPATSPGLAAHFLRLRGGESLSVPSVSSSSLYYVLQGDGELRRASCSAGADHGERHAEDLRLSWQQGDLFVLPAGATPLLQAEEESVLYWVHDGPLLRYLGVEPSRPRFSPCHYPSQLLETELQRLLDDPVASRGNRLSILLGHDEFPATRTVSHTLWAMLGVVPDGAVQPPHRHQSVAIDLIIDCDPGCHTLVGSEIDGDGNILNPTRVEWQGGGVFITPPGLWHAHVNESGRQARLLPIQDAGLHTYLRSLDIRFASGFMPPVGGG
jgi:gentisate 1,2-dioxygenase